MNRRFDCFEKNEVRRKKKNSTSFSSSSSTKNSEFPSLNDDAGAHDSLSTSATECDNTETGL